MSYLELPAGIADFDKAAISLWFRVPHESITEAMAASGDLLQHTIPLVTWGKPQTRIRYEPIYQAIDVWHYEVIPPNPREIELVGYANVGTDPVDPSFIGVKCKTVSGSNRAALVFNIQMADLMAITSARWSRTVMEYWSNEQMPPGSVSLDPGSGYQSTGFGVSKATLIDLSYVLNAQPEMFYVETEHELEPDHWHHLLLSFDLTGSCAIGHPNPTSSCKLWYAIDDIDYRGAANLQPYRDVGDGLDANAVVTGNVYNQSGGDPEPDIFYNYYVYPASGDYIPTPITSADAKLGIPASITHVDNVYPVETAELQFFTGVTLDTGNEDNRRAFITAIVTDPDDVTEQIGGAPVSPARTLDDPKDPTSARHSPAERLLGRKPEILLHGSTNWIGGKNTGPMIDNPAYDSGKPESPTNPRLIPDPEKQFTPTGKIVSYTPDPSLHGPQSPAASTRAAA